VARALATRACRVTVAVVGAQSLAPVCPGYNAATDRFVTTWETAKRVTGAATVRISIAYPGTSTQVVDSPVTLVK
jgi:hypothetical protein